VTEVDHYVLLESRKLSHARWPLDDKELVASAGACLKCGKRTHAQAQLFQIGDTDSDDACLDAVGRERSRRFILALRFNGSNCMHAQRRRSARSTTAASREPRPSGNAVFGRHEEAFRPEVGRSADVEDRVGTERAADTGACACRRFLALHRNPLRGRRASSPLRNRQRTRKRRNRNK
jgi:hypothetical protein